MIKALENLSNRITVNYEEKPCYHIVFSDSFTNLLVELEKFNIKNRKREQCKSFLFFMPFWGVISCLQWEKL